MSQEAPAYGLWLLVIFYSAIFIMFAYSFFKPQTTRDWPSLKKEKCEQRFRSSTKHTR
jgi:hypothetical protein